MLLSYDGLAAMRLTPSESSFFSSMPEKLCILLMVVLLVFKTRCPDNIGRLSEVDYQNWVSPFPLLMQGVFYCLRSFSILFGSARNTSNWLTNFGSTTMHHWLWIVMTCQSFLWRPLTCCLAWSDCTQTAIPSQTKDFFGAGKDRQQTSQPNDQAAGQP